MATLDALLDDDIRMKGFLYKEIENTLSWRRRFFVLRQCSRQGQRSYCTLTYYASSDPAALANEPAATVFDLSRVSLANTKKPRPGRWQFRLNFEGVADNSKGNAKWVLAGASRAETVQWIGALVAAGVCDAEFSIGALDDEHAHHGSSPHVNPGAVLGWARRALFDLQPLPRARSSLVARAPSTVRAAGHTPPAWQPTDVAATVDWRPGRSSQLSSSVRATQPQMVGGVELGGSCTMPSAHLAPSASLHAGATAAPGRGSRARCVAFPASCSSVSSRGAVSSVTMTSSVSSALALQLALKKQTTSSTSGSASARVSGSVRATDPTDDDSSVHGVSGSVHGVSGGVHGAWGGVHGAWGPSSSGPTAAKAAALLRAAEGLSTPSRQRLVALLERSPARLEEFLLSLEGDAGRQPPPPGSRWRAAGRRLQQQLYHASSEPPLPATAAPPTAPLHSAPPLRPQLSGSKDTLRRAAAMAIQRLARGRSMRQREPGALSTTKRDAADAAALGEYDLASPEASRAALGGSTGEGADGEGADGEGAVGRCLVLGSLNMDLRAEAVSTWPDAGSTTVGRFSASPGGAGANEAVALAKMGLETLLVGRVGDDEMGHLLVQHLEGLGLGLLDLSGIRQEAGASTGVAMQLATSLDGKRAEVVCEGANSSVSQPEVDLALDWLPEEAAAPAAAALASSRWSARSTESSARSRSQSVNSNHSTSDGHGPPPPPAAAYAAAYAPDACASTDGVSAAPAGASGSAARASLSAATRGEGAPLRTSAVREPMVAAGLQLVLLQLELPLRAMRQVAGEARRRGCLVALRACPLPHGVRHYQAKAEALLRAYVDMLFVSEFDAPELLGWDRQHAPLLTAAHADRAAEAILLRWPSLQLVVVSSVTSHVCRERVGRLQRGTQPRQSYEERAAVHGGIGAAGAGAQPPSLVRGAHSFESWQDGRRTEDDGSLPALDLVAQVRVAGDAAARSDAPLGSRHASVIGRERAAAESAVTLVLPRLHLGIEDATATDAFVGAFLAARCRRLTAAQALLWAHGASLMVTARGREEESRSGAHASMPTAAELEALLTELLQADAESIMTPMPREGGTKRLSARRSGSSVSSASDADVGSVRITVDDDDEEEAGKAMRYLTGPPRGGRKATSLPEIDSTARRDAAMERHVYHMAASHAPMLVPSPGELAWLHPASYLGQNAWHVIALSSSLPALSLLLSGGSAAGQPDNDPAAMSPRFASALQPLRDRDAFGLTPVQRAFECLKIDPASPRLLVMLRLLLATRMLLAASVGVDVLAARPGAPIPIGFYATAPPARSSQFRRSRTATVHAVRTVAVSDEECSDPESMRDDEAEELEEVADDRSEETSIAPGGVHHHRTAVGRVPEEEEGQEEGGEAAPNDGEIGHAAKSAFLSEPTILGDGEWIFGYALPADALDAAALIALELLLGREVVDAAGPAVGSDVRAAQERDVSVGVVVHTCLPALSDLEAHLVSSSGSEGASAPATTATATFGQALVRARASDGSSLLVAAARAGAAPLVERLLNMASSTETPYTKSLIDIGATTENGQSALHAAAGGCHREVCALLLARTGLPLVGPDAMDSKGQTPMDVCSPALRDELRELWAASDAAGSTHATAMHRRVLSGSEVIAHRYAVHTRVGKRVVLARDIVRHRAVALKFCGSRELLQREASLLNIVGPEVCPEVFDTIFDEGGEDGKQHVLVMQSADSNYNTPSSRSELQHFCSKRRGGHEARTNALRLVQCVSALHDCGLCHTDLKIEHFLRFDGDWKLVDLGSVVHEGKECVPACTVRYAPPEVALAALERKPLRITAAVDVWALGVILYTLFTAKPLLDEEQLSLHNIARNANGLVHGRLQHDDSLHNPERRLLLNLLSLDPEARGREAHLSSAVGPAGESAWSTPALRDTLNRGYFALGEDTEEAKHVEVLALFSSPRKWGREDNNTSALPVLMPALQYMPTFAARAPCLPHLPQHAWIRPVCPLQIATLSAVRTSLHTVTPLQLMREVTAMQESVPRRLREVRPAARFPDDIAAAVRQSSPRVLQFSGHGVPYSDGSRRLAFEVAGGVIQLPDPAEMIALLDRRNMPRLECVFLNACSSLVPAAAGGKSLGEHIAEALPHLIVIGWRSIVEDRACAAFSRGFYDALAKGCTGSGVQVKVSIAEAYRGGVAAFIDAGKQRGDPAVHGRSVHGIFGFVQAKLAIPKPRPLELGVQRRRSASAVAGVVARATDVGSPGPRDHLVRASPQHRRTASGHGRTFVYRGAGNGNGTGVEPN